MFSENLVTQAVVPLSFLRLKSLIYGIFYEGTDVRHMLRFSRWGQGRHLLTGVYGFGHFGADAFAAKCLHKYGGKVYDRIALDRKYDVLIKLSLGRLAGWQPRDSIDTQRVENGELTRFIWESANRWIMPMVQTIRTPAEILNILQANVSPCPWAVTNGAARAAQIAYLSMQFGASPKSVRTSIQEFDKYVAAQLSPDCDLDTYIDRVIADAGREVNNS